MDVLDAIQKRCSTRDFSDKPVARETVLNILSAALRSPSGGNGQPWELFVASGVTLERIRAQFQERFEKGGTPPGPGGMPQLPPAIQERMATIRRERMQLLGLNPDDPASGRVFMEWGSKLYGAQVLAVVCMEKSLTSFLDLGLLIQTICLAAQGYGVDSIIASSLTIHQDILRKELEIPEEYNLVTSVGLGYANPQSKINAYHSPRRPIEEVVRFKD